MWRRAQSANKEGAKKLKNHKIIKTLNYLEKKPSEISTHVVQFIRSNFVLLLPHCLPLLRIFLKIYSDLKRLNTFKWLRFSAIFNTKILPENREVNHLIAGIDINGSNPELVWALPGPEVSRKLVLNFFEIRGKHDLDSLFQSYQFCCIDFMQMSFIFYPSVLLECFLVHTSQPKKRPNLFRCMSISCIPL